MKAATARRYGGPDVIQIEDLPPPEIGPDDILLRVEATAVNSADWRLRSLEVPKGFGLLVRLMMGWSRPRNPVLGFDAAGTVEAVGDSVTRAAPGDRVVVSAEATRAAHAQYMRVPTKAPLVHLPDDMGFDTAAAAVFGGNTALHFLDKAGAKAGQSLLVNGASGTVGSALVQLAHHRGLTVAGVCSAANADLVRKLGAKEVIDYRSTPIAGLERSYDLVADAVGTAPWQVARHLVAPGGRYLMIVASSFGDMLMAGFRGGQGRKIVAGNADARQDLIEQLISLCDQGAWTPVIDSSFPLNEARAAHERVDTGHKVGSVLLLPQV